LECRCAAQWEAASQLWLAGTGSTGAPLGFLMYPQAETSEGRLDSLDPDNFRYEIASKEIPPAA
jgi:hypothetical protein